MILGIIMIFVINILMINIWIWIIRSHFDLWDSKKFLIISLCTGLGAIGLLKLLHFGIDQINIASIWDPGRTMTTFETVLFVIMWHCIVSVIFVILSNRWFSQLQTILLVRGTLLIWSMSGISLMSIAGTTLYYLFVALSEEYVKSLSAYTRFAKYKLTSSDVIIFGLIASLGFACIENIIHLTNQITQLVTQHVISSSGIIVTKGIASTMMHLFFTSFFGVAYLHYMTDPDHAIKIIVLGMLGAVATHRSYDVMLSQWYRWILIIYMIAGYFWLTYVLYKSDRLYIVPDKLKKLIKDPL